MAEIDSFTQRRLIKFVETHRAREGALPTLLDFEAAGFTKELVNQAVRKKLLEELYVTLTNGSVMKGFAVVRG